MAGQIYATIRMFQPDINLSGVKVRPVPGHAAALYGEMTKAVLDVLQNAGRAMSVREIAAEIMVRKGLATDDGALVKNMHNRVGAALRTAKVRGTTQSERGDGLGLLWRLAG
jgi:hypothetical protein